MTQSEYNRQQTPDFPPPSDGLPLVSVIIRSMDRPTLSEALDSVALQTYPNIEVVIVNARGTEHREPGKWCGRFPMQMFGDSRQLKRSQAANVGLDSARGTFFIFLDDDDLFDPEHIATLVEALTDSKNCLAAYAGVRVEDEAGMTIGIYNQTFSAVRLMAGNFIPIHAILFKRDLIEQGCRFDEHLDSYEDWDFWLQAARLTNFTHTTKVTATYRAYLGESGMALPVDLKRQQQCRLIVWRKWWPKWKVEDFDRLMADFRQQQEHAHVVLAERDGQINTLNQVVAERDGQINTLNQTVAERDAQINTLNQAVAERDGQINTLNQAMAVRDGQIEQLQSTIEEILNSSSWKITAPLRFMGRTILYARKVIAFRKAIFNLALRYSRNESVCKLFKRTFSIMRYEGLNGIKWRLKVLNTNNDQIAAGIVAKPLVRIENNFLPLSTIDITKYDFFFFDVFDTAIIRLFQRPTDLFEYISLKTKAPDFHVRRIQQEARTRELCLGRKDISIFEIYNNIADASIDEEIAAELKFCVANPEVYLFYSKLLAAGKKIYFVSDMYLDKSTVVRILEKNAFSSYEDVYVSSEDDLIKGDGSRFDWLKKHLPESIGTAIHIGDNIVSDFIQPRAHGFEALHFMESNAYYQHDSFLYSKIEFLNLKRSLGLSFMLSGFRYWKSGFHDQPPNYWRQFGFLYGGGLVSAFCGFINQELSRKSLSCSRIYFLARDGDIMSQVYRLLYDDVEAVYLMASRRCMSFPSFKSLTHADDADTLRLFTTTIGVTGAKDVLDRFSYTDLYNLEADLNKIVTDPSKWTDQDIINCILRNKDSIMEKVVTERAVLFEYLSEMDFFDQEHIVIADVGWGGTIQNSLIKLLELGGYNDRHLHGIYLGVNDCVAHKQNKTGFLFDGNQSQFVEYLNLIELITSSPQNGVVRIDHADGNFVPVTETGSEHENQRQLVAAEIQKGIIDFAQMVKNQGIDSLDFIRPDDFKTLFQSLQDHASEEDVFQLGSLRHAMTLGNHYGQLVLDRKN